MMKNNNGAFTLLIGAALGVGLGMLLAPDKGKNTQQKIKDSLNDIKNDLDTQLEGITDLTKTKLETGKVDLKEKVDKFLSETSYKTDDAIDFLEQKLIKLREYNAKLKKQNA